LKTPVLVLFGPTASGKTGLLRRLFGGGQRRVEIISADSMQVYRGMDIGTAKPSPEERAMVPHHLIDIKNPDEPFNVGEFVRLALQACACASERGALPVVCGGAGFYLKTLALGLGEAPEADLQIRAILKEELSARGAASLMEELAKADPVSAGRIHINDEYRLLRALEVYRGTGRPLSSYACAWNTAPERLAGAPFRFLLVGLRRSREDLYRRVNDRAAAMFAAGLPAEVQGLYDAGYTPNDPALRAIGYREFFVEEGPRWRLSRDIAGVQALVAQNSRRFAKRQITFFAPLPGVKWIDCGNEDDAAAEVEREVQAFCPRS